MTVVPPLGGCLWVFLTYSCYLTMLKIYSLQSYEIFFATHSRGVSLLPVEVPLLLSEALGDHESDEHDIEQCYHGGQYDDLRLAMYRTGIENVCAQCRTDDQASSKGGRHLDDADIHKFLH